jgi:hypothetical protein
MYFFSLASKLGDNFNSCKVLENLRENTLHDIPEVTAEREYNLAAGVIFSFVFWGGKFFDKRHKIKVNVS